MDILVTDQESLLSTYDLCLKTWFVYGYRNGLQSETSVYEDMTALIEIFMEKKDQLKINDEAVVETVIQKFNEAFAQITQDRSEKHKVKVIESNSK